MNNLILYAFFMMLIACIQIPLHEGPRCMIISTAYEPLKVEMKFPQIPNKIEGEKYKITQVDFLTQVIEYENEVPDGFIYRKQFTLQSEKLYFLCMEVLKMRNSFKPGEQIYVQYSATEDFESLIGNVEIPNELQSEENLGEIYKLSESMNNINKEIIKNQNKELKLEEKLTISNLNKNERIVSLTLIECLVIVLSGIYQVFALRKFLIEKNLY